MLKFLRKYNTLILVVGGSLLMVVFLVPQAVEQIGRNPKRIPYATVEGQSINMQSFQEIQRDWQIVTQIVGEAISGLQIEGVDHWLLLTREAERLGLIGGIQDGAASVNFFADYVAQFLVEFDRQRNPFMFQTQDQYNAALQARSAEFRNTILERIEAQVSTGRPEAPYYRALAKLRGIARLLVTYQSLAGLSIPEMELAAADLFDRVEADLAIIPASAFRPEPEELAIDDVRSHFETYRGIRRGEGDFGFGYILPNAVRAEWVVINSAAITDSLDASPADLLEYYRRFRDTTYFGRDFETARSDVRRDYINAQTQQRLNDIQSAVRREQVRATQGLAMDDESSRYRVVPSDWQGPSLERYSEVIREASGLTGPPAQDLVTIREDDGVFLSRDDIRTSALSIFVYQLGGNEVINSGELLLMAKEFGGDERVNIQRGLLFGPIAFRRSGGVRDLAFVRITDVRFEGPADSLDEVEDQVRRDLATLRGYETLKSQVDSFRASFAQDSFAWLNEQPFAVADGTLQYVDAIVSKESVRDELGQPLFQLTNSLLPERFIERARTFNPLVPIDEIATDERTLAVLMPDTLSLGLGTIKAYRPATVDRLFEGMAEVERQITIQARSISTEAIYTFDSMARRMNFQRVNQEEE